MSRQIQIRRGTAAENDAFTGAIGEVTMDTTNNTLRVHDGATAGGTTLAKQSEIPTIPNCFPSDNYDTITPTGTGMTYTATANGWVTLIARSTSNNGFVFLNNDNNGIVSGYNTYSSNFLILCNIPVSKNQVVKIDYGNVNFEFIRFVYTA